MATSHFRQFLDAATGPAPGTDTPPGPGCLCGLRTRWCLPHRMTPKHDGSVRSGGRKCRIRDADGRLGTAGRAEPASIFNSYPHVA